MKTAAATAKSRFLGKFRRFRTRSTSYRSVEFISWHPVDSVRFCYYRMAGVGYRRPLARCVEVWHPDRGWVRHYFPPVRTAS